MAERIEGLNEMLRGFGELGVEIEDLKATMSEISAEAAELASSFAPRRSGKLASSVRGNKAKNKAVVIAGRARVPYAGAINYGWPKRGIKPSLFMQRADKAIAPRVIPMLEKGINDAIKKAGLQ